LNIKLKGQAIAASLTAS